MRIVSLNVNGFCGLADKRGYSFGGSGNSSEENSMEHAGKVCEAILKERADVVFLSEFDVCSAAGQEAIRRMERRGIFPRFSKQVELYLSRIYIHCGGFCKGSLQQGEEPGKLAAVERDALAGVSPDWSAHYPGQYVGGYSGGL